MDGRTLFVMWLLLYPISIALFERITQGGFRLSFIVKNSLAEDTLKIFIIVFYIIIGIVLF